MTRPYVNRGHSISCPDCGYDTATHFGSGSLEAAWKEFKKYHECKKEGE